jgi:RNA polymerase sigma-54 factor
MRQTIEQRMTTGLHLTPQLIQAMNILQMSAYDLYDYVLEQAEVNPCIEVEGEWASATARSKHGGLPADDMERAGREHSTDETVTLEQALLAQLRFVQMTEPLGRIVRYLAGNVDEHGYLRMTLEDICAERRIAFALAEKALALLQSLEPAGVGARNLQECLLIQIQRDERADPWAAAIVSGHLPDLAAGKLELIGAALGQSASVIGATLAYIRGLNPRPGSGFGPRQAVGFVADAVVRLADGRYIVMLNESQSPRIAINGAYARLADTVSDERAKLYIRGQLHEARSLMRSLEQRKATFAKVVEAVMEEQIGFLQDGPDALKPLKLKAIADKLQLHESTVSRAIQHKRVQTPFGSFELKAWFTNGFRTEAGDMESAPSVKAKIRRLIEQERAGSPLSDQQLADALARDGLHIARRTVMKYREELGFLSSRRRCRR